MILLLLSDEIRGQTAQDRCIAQRSGVRIRRAVPENRVKLAYLVT